MARRATPLETVSLLVPEEALPFYEQALLSICPTVGFFREEDEGPWRLEAVKPVGDRDGELATALLLAGALSGVEVPLERTATAAEGWLARNLEEFPEQLIGRRFAVRGTHETAPRVTGRYTLTVDAGLAFGSGEHGSTRGCLRALEFMAHRKPRRILELGTGSGILAIGAAKHGAPSVDAVDIDPDAVQATLLNAESNQVTLHAGLPDLAQGHYQTVLANILATPLKVLAPLLCAHVAGCQRSFGAGRYSGTPG